MKINAVIFDLFGTLVDDFATSVGRQTYTELAKALEVPYEQFMQLWRETSEMRTGGAFQTVETSIEHVCDTMGVRVAPEQMKKAVEIRLQQMRHALQPRPDAVATLARLKNECYKLGLLSNCSIEIPILWHETAFAELIDSAIFSSRERLKKPDPRIYHLACERIGVIAEDCLYIADGENHELAGAAKVGLHSVLIRNSSRDNGSELLREARDWNGSAVSTLPDVLALAGVKD
jgi:putative hydrolase of the HAD superfamily